MFTRTPHTALRSWLLPKLLLFACLLPLLGPTAATGQVPRVSPPDGAVYRVGDEVTFSLDQDVYEYVSRWPNYPETL